MGRSTGLQSIGLGRSECTGGMSARPPKRTLTGRSGSREVDNRMEDVTVIRTLKATQSCKEKSWKIRWLCKRMIPCGDVRVKRA